MSKVTQFKDPDNVFFGMSQPSESTSGTNGQHELQTSEHQIGVANDEKYDNPLGYDKSLLEMIAQQDRRGWMMKARCAYPDVDIEVFFSEGKELPAVRKERIEKAKRYCGECAVSEVCLEYGLELHAEERGVEGIFGGIGERDRTKLLRERKRTATSSPI